MKGPGIHWYFADCNKVANKILTKLGALQEPQDKLEVKLVEMRKKLKTMNRAVEGMQKIIENLRKTKDKAYMQKF